MKKIAFLTIIFFYSVLTYSQETSVINIGFGIPFFFQSNFDKNSGGTHSINSIPINIFVEKPQLIKFHEIKSFAITPGVAYFLFNESATGGGLGGGSSKTYKHQAISLYTKFLYESNLKADKPFNWYGGILTGVYLYSKTTGEEYWWRMQQSQNVSGSQEIDRNGKPFFNSFYMGFLAGFKTFANSNSFLRPAFELSFSPNYATIYDSHLSMDEQKVAKSMAMLTIILGLGKKKLPELTGSFL